jgi:hypothetical protein
MARMLAERDSDGCVILVFFGGVGGFFALDLARPPPYCRILAAISNDACFVALDINSVEVREKRVPFVIEKETRLQNLALIPRHNRSGVQIGAIHDFSQDFLGGVDVSCCYENARIEFHIKSVFVHHFLLRHL